MTDATALALGQEVLLTTLKVAGPPLAASLAVGLVVGLLQAVTQVSDPTLSFVPKLLAVGAVLLFFGAGLLRFLTDVARTLLGNLPQFLH